MPLVNEIFTGPLGFGPNSAQLIWVGLDLFLVQWASVQVVVATCGLCILFPGRFRVLEVRGKFQRNITHG